jgi:hypothetical protein
MAASPAKPGGIVSLDHGLNSAKGEPLAYDLARGGIVFDGHVKISFWSIGANNGAHGIWTVRFELFDSVIDANAATNRLAININSNRLGRAS